MRVIGIGFANANYIGPIRRLGQLRVGHMHAPYSLPMNPSYYCRQHNVTSLLRRIRGTILKDAFKDQLRVLSLLSLPVYQAKIKSGGEQSLGWWLGFFVLRDSGAKKRAAIRQVPGSLETGPLIHIFRYVYLQPCPRRRRHAELRGEAGRIVGCAAFLARQARQPAVTSELLLLVCIACSPFSVLRTLIITADQIRWGTPTIPCASIKVQNKR